jgi:hypothetical protein
MTAADGGIVMKTLLLVLAVVSLAACEETTTVSPSPLGQTQVSHTQTLHASGTVQSGVAKTVKH